MAEAASTTPPAQAPDQKAEEVGAKSHSESQGYPPLPDPNLKGDPQGAQTSAYLRRRINEEQFDAFCIDCQDNRSTHCNVTFGTFICAQCAQAHEDTFPYF